MPLQVVSGPPRCIAGLAAEKDGGKIMRTRRRYIVALIGVTLLAAAACGNASSDKDSGSDAKPTAPADPEVAKTQITEAYTNVFNGANSDLEQRLTYVSDSTKLRDTFLQAAQAAGATFTQTSAVVKKVEFTGPETADVWFDIAISGTPTIVGDTSAEANGKAVFDAASDKWVVHSQTVCDLTALVGVPCPA
jgi:hypothetical protein